jgi:hypothetical protein
MLVCKSLIRIRMRIQNTGVVRSEHNAVNDSSDHWQLIVGTCTNDSFYHPIRGKPYSQAKTLTLILSVMGSLSQMTPQQQLVIQQVNHPTYFLNIFPFIQCCNS